MYRPWILGWNVLLRILKVVNVGIDLFKLELSL